MTITENQTIGKNIKSSIKECAGCSACANICPVNAIKLEENEIGYYQPIIDEEKCIHCGKCEKLCPEINPIKGNTTKPEVYACQANDDIRYVSSSGGVFTLLAEEILAKGGYVAGVGFDENWKVHHMIINSIEKLDKLRRSKYVQSYIREDFYKDIEKLLKDDNYVLFSGCPCQAAGLRSYLGKNYDKLYIVDLLCAHSASPKAYRKFLADNYPSEEIKNINFRSKIKGWDAHTVVITEQHPQEEITHNFMTPYAKHLMMNECCKNCKYTTTSRQGDITIGDYWGIGKRAPHLDDRKGTSCVLINSEKGKQIFNQIKSKFKLLEKRTLKDAIKSNWVLKGHFPPHPCIDMFNKNMDSKNFNENVNECLSNKYNVGIMGWFWVPNRGAILTNYALNEAIKELGYNVKTINFIPQNGRKNTYSNSIAEKFAKKYLKLTHVVTSRQGLKQLNNYFSTFIVGSDQLWRWVFRKYPLGHLFLNFVNNNKKLFSYSTSFGTERYDGPEEARILRQHYLKRFDGISVREYDGVNILQEDFGLKGIQVIDPVFLVDKSKYEIIINNSDKKEQNYIAYYMIAPTEDKMKIVKMAEEKFGIKSVDIKGNLPVEDWLYYIKNCKFLITDSFHGTCFATIFNKNFISINVCNEKPTRFETILNITNMMDRLLLNPNDIYDRQYLFDEIDWTDANVRLESEISRGKNWLKYQLEKPKQEHLSEEDKLFDAILNMAQNEMDNRDKQLSIYANRLKIYYKYYSAKLLFNFTFGKQRNKFKKQKDIYKPMIRTLRKIKGRI